MSDHSYLFVERQKEARKLRELFKGRFSDEEAMELMREHATLPEAVDFILNGDPEEVRKLIYDRNEALVEALRRDSAYINVALNQGLEASIRLFACQGCDNYWWRKVPTRKEVSRCKLCKTKYDPVPHDQEWGLAEYVCMCGNVFWGSGWMNHTQSPCYNCQGLTCPTRIVPPLRPRNQRKRAEHSCTGSNCYNRAQGGQHPPSHLPNPGGGNGFNLCDSHRNVCSHERSWRQRRVLYPSRSHVSTGSTVHTFMSQGELAEVYEDLQPVNSLPNVPEEDED